VPQNSAKKKTTIGIPTIGDVKSRLAQKEAQERNKSEEIQELEVKSSEYTDEDLKQAWASFIDLRKQNGGEQEVAFLKHNYIRSNDVITIQIHNSILENTYDKIRVELLAHLRTALQNDKIRVDLEKLESESKKMIYTNKEKFDHLAEKYPAIKSLQEKLSLDPDY